MNNDIAIQVAGLGKKYLIGHQSGRRDTFRDVLTHAGSSMVRAIGDMVRGRQLGSGGELEEFWALRGLDFEIKRGDVVGIIGRNGAGKSTLLKVLSRITEPSEGQARIRGRVASLLEVGTGFHPELTGRENIFLNGAILGMGRSEIKRKFDEIVDFAGVERFLDTPVKRYSSGMYVRLAFSVAAHLEPEILIVDEVLAVGDSEFQQKCLGKMQDVAGHGRTVLFVSHNMAAVRQLCQHGIYLVAGQCRYVGSINDAIVQYLNAGEGVTAHYIRGGDIKETKPQLVEASVLGVDWNAQIERLELTVSLTVQSPVEKRVCLDLRLKDHTGSPAAFSTSGALDSTESIPIGAGRTTVTATLDITPLAVGSYTVGVDINVPWLGFDDRIEDALRFEIGSEHWHFTVNPLRLDYGLGATFITSKFTAGAAYNG